MTGWWRRPGSVVCVGEPLAVFRAERPGVLRAGAPMTLDVGGAEANVAVGLAAQQQDAVFVGRVGDDALGRAVVAHLRGEGVDVRCMRVDPAGSTGAYARHAPTSGAVEATYLRACSAGSRLAPEDVDDDLLRSAGVIVTSGITAAISSSARRTVASLFDRADAAGAPVVFDLNMRRRLWSPDEAGQVLADLASRATVATGTDDELQLLASPLGVAEDLDAVIDKLLGSGVTEVLVRSEHSVASRTPEGEVVHAYERVPDVDPVGAGDALLAAVLGARRVGASLSQSLARGAAAGSRAVRSVGETPASWQNAAADRTAR